MPLDADEREIYARRIVAGRCLYGVDINPLAVEMAKLSLWLLTLAKDRPFTFLDHAIRCGDSLVGISDTKQLSRFSLSGEGLDMPLLQEQIKKALEATRLIRKNIVELPDATLQNVKQKLSLLKDAEEQTRRLCYAADMLVASSWQPMSEQDRTDELKQSLLMVEQQFSDLRLDELERKAKRTLTEADCKRTFHWPLEFPEVFVDRGGFDAFVCNPPFIGGQKITGNLGEAYREHLVTNLASGQRGSADLCSYFFLRAGQLFRDGGQLGFLATNTISQGDTREVGLDQLIANGCIIPRAVRSRPWPGTANLEVAHVWVRRGSWNGPSLLNDEPTDGITAFLTPGDAASGRPYRLVANEDKSFIGSYVLGMGFVLEPEEAQRLIEKNACNKDVLFPYLNGEDLNSRPDQSPSRWVINFFDWPIEKARQYPDCISILEEKVKPERLLLKNNNDGKSRKTFWWQYGRIPSGLSAGISGMDHVLVGVLHTKYWSVARYHPSLVFSHALVVFSKSDFASFSVLESFFHESWAREYSSSLETRMRYTPSDCFRTFPFPDKVTGLESIGEHYYDYRRKIMLARNEGLTETYNRFHDTGDASPDIQKLRQLHVDTDNAVGAAYGWTDLDLSHDFHKTEQGIRFTISEAARMEVLARLLKLNHERYAEEVKKGLHEKKGGTRRVANAGRAKRSLPGFEEEAEPASEQDAPGPVIVVERRTEAKPAVADRPATIDEIETNEVMAAFRQAARGKGWMDREDLVKEVSSILGYQRVGTKIDEALRNHLRAAIRRRIIEADGAALVRTGTTTMADYGLDELREAFASVMRKGTSYERDDVIHAIARYLGFARLTNTIRQPFKSAINSAIRQQVLDYEGSLIWRD